MKRATIKDVAAAAGVSIATVSHVLNETKFVSKPNRQRVLEAVAELDYRPSGVAASLRRQTSGVIGLVLPMQGRDTSAAFFTMVADGIERTVSEYGYRTIISNTEEDATRERAQLQLLRGQFTDFIDGLIIAPTVSDPATRHEGFDGVPVVYVDRLPLQESGDVDFVGTDNYEISVAGLQRLVEAEVHEVVCISSPIDVSSMVDRRRAFVDTVGPICEDVESRILVTESSFDAGYRAGLEALRLYPEMEALFITNNTIAMGVIKALREQRGEQADQLQLLVYDDYDWMGLISPPVDSIAQPAFDMGRRAAEVLMEKLRDPERKPRREIVKSQLVIRSTN